MEGGLIFGNNMRTGISLKIFLTLTLILVMWQGESLAIDFYVDADNGSNSNDGLQPDSAWKTIAYALSQVISLEENPTTIHVAAGIYDTDMGVGGSETFPLFTELFIQYVVNSKISVKDTVSQNN